MSHSSLPPMPRFATPTKRAEPGIATLPPVEDTPRPEDLPHALTHEDLLLRVPPAPRATQPLPVPIAFTAPKPVPATTSDPRLTDDDISLLRYIAETPGAHGCPIEEGAAVPRELLLALLGQLETKHTPRAGRTDILQERITALVRQAYHDAFVAVGGSISLLIIESVFDASQARRDMDALINQMRSGAI